MQVEAGSLGFLARVALGPHKLLTVAWEKRLSAMLRPV